MRFPTRLLGFIGRVILIFIPVTVAWYFIAPHYTQLLVNVVDGLSAGDVAIAARQNTIEVGFHLSIGSARSYVINGLDLQYGLLLAVALIGATPGLRLRRRATHLAIAVLTVFVIHIITLMVFTSVARSATSASIGGHPLVVLFCIVGCDLFPVLVWGGLSFSALMSSRQTDLSSGSGTAEPRRKLRQTLSAWTGGVR